MSVGWSVAIVNPAKTAELIEMLFGVWNRVGPRNHALDDGPDHPMRRGNFDQKNYLHGKWLAERARSTILQQQHPSLRETLDQVHFSYRRPC